MTPLSSSLAIQSWCFREFKTNQEVIKGLQDCGVAAVELCGVHVDFGKRDSFAEVAKLYQDHGIEIVSIGVTSVANGADSLRQPAEFVQAAGARFMSISSSPEAGLDGWALAGKVAEEYDLRFGIHNHGGYDWLGSSQMLGFVLKNSSDRIGLCIDTAWTLDAGEDPFQWLERYSDRVFGLHLKDFTFDRARKQTDVVIGTGNIDLPRLAKVSQSLPNLGYAVIEYEGEAENPVPSLTRCVQAVHAAL